MYIIPFSDGIGKVEFMDDITQFGDYAFYYCRSLTSIKIPNSVTIIGNSAFRDCTNLSSIEIPNSVTSMGGFSFYNCSNLTSVTYNGTQAEWNAIPKGGIWKNGVPKSCKVHCIDGDIAF